jgi:hypothetical protein
MAGLSNTSWALVEPAFVVVGHDWYFYLVYLRPDGAIHVLEDGSCSTINLSGVFKILRVLRNVVEYGLEYWDDFLGPVLEKLGGKEMPSGNASTASLRDEGIDMGSVAASLNTV